MKEVLITKKGVLDKKAKINLANAGIAYIEVSNPDDIKVISIHCDTLNSKDAEAFVQAMKIIGESAQVNSEKFVKELYKIYHTHQEAVKNKIEGE